MRPEDVNQFNNILRRCMTMYRRNMGEAELHSWWELLEHIPIEQFEYGIKRHQIDEQEGMYAPKPANIIRQIKIRMRLLWHTPNEAWTIVHRAGDERETVIFPSRQAKEAFFRAAYPIIHENKISARSAFIEVYSRLKEDAIERGEMPQYQVSVGHDPDLRLSAFEKAFSDGIIPYDDLDKHHHLLESWKTEVSQDIRRLLGFEPDNNKMLAAPESNKESLGLRPVFKNSDNPDVRAIAETLNLKEKPNKPKRKVSERPSESEIEKRRARQSALLKANARKESQNESNTAMKKNAVT